MEGCTKYCTPDCHWHESREGLIDRYVNSVFDAYSFHSLETKRLCYVIERDKHRQELWNNLIG